MVVMIYVCHNLTQKGITFNDVEIVSVKENDYRIHFCYMCKHETIKFL